MYRSVSARSRWGRTQLISILCRTAAYRCIRSLSHSSVCPTRTSAKAGHLVGYSERKDVIKRELDLCGYFCIVTSEEMTASQALIHYKGRDVSEKLFSADKSFIGSKSMRVQTTQALSAKIFVEFIALIVRNRMYNLLKETM